MTNRARVLKALRGAPSTGRTVADITARDLAGKLTTEKTETALVHLFHDAQVEQVDDGRYRLPQ